MATNKKPLRLNKVAKEFNLGIQTIVEFLNEKGVEVEPKPNAKIDPEAYDLLIQEFQSDKTVKEESQKIGLKHAKRESITIEDKEEEEDGEEEGEKSGKEEELFIHGGVQKDNTEESVTTGEETEEETQQDQKEGGGTEKEKEAKGPETKEFDKQEKDEKSQLEATKATMGTPEAEAEKTQEAGTVETEPESKAVKKTEEKQKKVTPGKKKKSESSKGKEKSSADQKEKESGKKGEKETKASKAVKDAEVEIKGPQVQGKIDLENLETLTRPVKKSKSTDKQEKAGKKETKSTQQSKEKKQTKKAKSGTPTNEEETELKQKPESAGETKEEPAKEESQPEEQKADSENYTQEKVSTTQYEKLDGPTILGKMDLPDSGKKAPKKPKAKKPVASSADESISKNKRKKRKRIKKKAVDTKDTKETKEESKKEQEKTSQKKAEETKSKSKSKRSKRKKSKPAKPESSEEEVQKQIKETLEKLQSSGKSKAAKIRREKRRQASESRIKEEERKEQEKQKLQVTEFVTVNELANMMDVNVNDVISACMDLGMVVSINQRLDAESITILADEFGYEVEFISVAEQGDDLVEEEDDPEEMEPRSPIVTVMGHVDHGKTSLLDYIRKANVIGGESGGITQHIGAYQVDLGKERAITFLDTPGHEAFTAMRARGANITDIAIVVIAADDKVMPQTKEAIDHAQAAGVPIIFAINKIDNPGAAPDKVKEELANMNLLVEDWGGKYQSQDISAKKGTNVESILEKVLLEAELLELQTNPNKKAVGTVLESSLDRGRGYVANLLIQAGTLNVGDFVVAGSHYGRVRAMYNERNRERKSAGPSEPVLMLGLHGAPSAGDRFSVMEDEREGKNIAIKRQQLQREQGIRSQKHVTLDEIGRRIAVGDFKELNIIVKGDVDGSVEAIADELLKLSSEEVQVNVIHKSVGQIIESDVLLASASDAIIVGFQVRPSGSARKLADREQIDIRTYSVIYEAKKEVMNAIEGLLSPEIKEKVVGNIEVRDTFKISKVGTVAGCYVLDGKITRNSEVRLIWDGIVKYTGKLGSLKRYKDDVKEVSKGYECGLNIEKYNDVKVGDVIEAFEKYEVKRSLDDMKSEK